MLEVSALRFINRHGLIPQGARLLVGVSGGPDSLALLHFLWNLREERQLTIVVAHFDHMFRGKQSYEDLLFVKDYCNEHDIPIETVQVDVPQYMEQTGNSTQVAARECRYIFFDEVMEKHQLDFLALGHHGDDQVETILMRLTRGSSGKARGGIPIVRDFSRGEIVRPFLGNSKEEIELYCLRHHLKPRIDPSNAEDDYLRNRLRREVLTSLKRENARVHEQFQRFSEELSEDEAFLQKLTRDKIKHLLHKGKRDEIILEITPFLTMPNSLQRRGIQLILKYLYEERPTSLSATHINEVLTLIKKDHPSGELHFPLGLHVIKSYGNCCFQFAPAVKTDYYFELSHPGTVLLLNDSKITMEYTKSITQSFRKSNDVLFLDPHEVKLPISIRTRQAGDRMIPKGMIGSKKIKSIFIEEKIPLVKRDEWPIVTDGEGEIVWLPRLKKSHLDRSDESLTEYLVLAYDD